MAKWYEDCKEARALELFDILASIPRVSGNEKAVSDYIATFGKNLGLMVYQDEEFNVVIRKNATPGYECLPTVILQSHIDIVGDKVAGKVHDFARDPITVLRDGDKIYADGTTLGADDGTGVAYMLAILERDDLKHPEIEAVFTTNEETDMRGAMRLDYSRLHGRLVINLDFTSISVGGAGQRDFALSLMRRNRTIGDRAVKMLSITGLLGGHSGNDAVYERGNANVMAARILFDFYRKYDIRIVHFNTGGMENICAIPREVRCSFTVDDGYRSALAEDIEIWTKQLREEYSRNEPDISIVLEDYQKDSFVAADKAGTEALLQMLLLLPDGIANHNKLFPEKAESSANLAIVKSSEEEFSIRCNIRYAYDSRRDYMTNRIRLTAELLRASFAITCDLPSWQYDPHGRLPILAKQVFTDFDYIVSQGTGEEGIFQKNLPESEIIGISPMVYNCHSPAEWFSIRDFEKQYNLLCKLLAHLIHY